MLLGCVVDRERWWMRISKGNMELQVRVLYFVVGGVRPLDGVAGSSPVVCGRGVRPREGCVERIINIHVK